MMKLGLYGEPCTTVWIELHLKQLATVGQRWKTAEVNSIYGNLFFRVSEASKKLIFRGHAVGNQSKYVMRVVVDLHTYLHLEASIYTLKQIYYHLSCTVRIDVQIQLPVHSVTLGGNYHMAPEN